MLLFLTSTALAEKKKTNIYAVKASQALVIDGNLTTEEWGNATDYTLSKETASDCGQGAGSDVIANYCLMWDDKGLYMKASVKDSTIAPSVEAGKALNVTDGMQIGLNPSNKREIPSMMPISSVLRLAATRIQRVRQPGLSTLYIKERLKPPILKLQGCGILMVIRWRSSCHGLRSTNSMKDLFPLKEQRWA